MNPSRAVAALLAVAVSCSNGTSSTGSTSPAAETGPTTEASAPATTTPAPGSDSTSSTTSTTVAAIPMPVFDPELLPAVAVPTALAGADPATRVVELLAATSDELDDVDAGWAAVYAELGIPLIDSAGASTIAGDPIGPRWDHVWSIGGLSRGAMTVPLSDLGATLSFEEAEPIDPEVLLADVRSAAVSTDPGVQTFGLFVAGKALANGGSDPLDPAVTADQVALDAATIQLISWVAARDAFQVSAMADLAAYSPPAGFANPARRAGGSVPCSEALGTADETSWINWLAGKAGGGVGVDGVVSTPGLVEALVARVTQATQGIDAAKQLAAKAAKFINRFNFVASVLSLAAQVNAVQVNPSMDPDPLIRRRESRDGKTANVSLGLSFSANALDGNKQALCALSIVANVMGVGLSFPPDGAPLANVEVIVTSGRNFGTKVYFGAKADRKRVTDGKGLVDIEVQGKARKKDLPQTAPARNDEFGLNLATQVEELTGQSILNVFIDGLSLGAGAPSGIVDVAKSLHFDLGEYIFRFVDYDSGYKVSVTSDWAFPESGLSLKAVITDAVLEPDESGNLAGSALVTWTGGIIGNSVCSLAESVTTSSAVLTGVVGEQLTITIQYDEASLTNTVVCPYAGREWSFVASTTELVVVGAPGQPLQGVLDQTFSVNGQSRLGTAAYTVTSD